MSKLATAVDPTALLKEAADSALAATGKLQEVLAAIRERIAAAKLDLERAERALISRAEAVCEVENAVRIMARKEERATVCRLLSRSRDNRGIDVAGGLRDASAASLLAHVVPEQLSTWMLRELDAEAASRGGWSTRDAAERVIDVDRAKGLLASLERIEEQLIAKAEAAGIFLPRRSDASPAAVLGLP